MIKDRLKSLAKYVLKTDKVIDIGCDHALLDIYLIKHNIVDKIIISDISKNALEQGIKNVDKYNLSNNIDARCGNGLLVLTSKDCIDTIIISGMGAYTILDILNNDYLKKITKLIIQSNKDYELLREKITQLGFFIDCEEVVEENNKIYINMIFKRGKSNLSAEEILYGTNSMINKEIYYKYLIEKYNKIYKNSKDIEILNKIQFLKSLINTN